MAISIDDFKEFYDKDFIKDLFNPWQKLKASNLSTDDMYYELGKNVGAFFNVSRAMKDPDFKGFKDFSNVRDIELLNNTYKELSEMYNSVETSPRKNFAMELGRQNISSNVISKDGTRIDPRTSSDLRAGSFEGVLNDLNNRKITVNGEDYLFQSKVGFNKDMGSYDFGFSLEPLNEKALSHKKYYNTSGTYKYDIDDLESVNEQIDNILGFLDNFEIGDKVDLNTGSAYNDFRKNARKEIKKYKMDNPSHNTISTQEEFLEFSKNIQRTSQNTRKPIKLKNADKSYRPDVIMNGNNIEFDSIYNYSTPKKVKTRTGNTQTNNVNTSSTSNTPTKTFQDWRDQHVTSGLWTTGQGEDGSLGRVKMDMSKGSKTPGYSNTDDIQLMNSWAMATDQEIDDYIERISKEGYGEDDLKKIKNMIYDERNVGRHISVDDWLKKGNVRQNHTDAYRHFTYNGKEYYATGKGTTGFWNPNDLESPVFMTVIDAETGKTVDFGKNFFNPDSPDPSNDYDYFYKVINDVEDLGYVSLNDMKDHVNKNIEKNKNNAEVNTQQTQTHTQQQQQTSQTQQQQQQQQQRRKINQNDPASWTDDDIKYMADDDPDTIDFLKKKRDQARQQQRQQQQQTRKDRTNTDKPQTRTRTSRRNDTGPKYDYSTYVNRSVINIDESTARSTMDISDPFVIKQTIKDANGNTRDIIHRRKSRWGDETVLESDITWNADGVYDNINKTYSGKDISPIEWKDAAYWSDDYILGRAGDDEKLLNSMLNARDRKLETQRRYEESRVETNAEDIESAWEDDWEPDPNWKPDPEYDVDVPQNNNGQNIFNNGDPADWTDEMIKEMADGDYDVYQDLISQRKAAQASRPDMNDPMNWSDDYIDQVSEGDPHYYKNMMDKRDAARKNYRQKRKGVYKKYGKNFEPEELSKKQKTKIQQPKTNKEKKNRKKQNEKNRRNKKLEDRWKAQGYDPDEKRRANFEANQERKIEKAQQAAEAQTTTETPETPKTEPPKYTNYGPRVQTEPEGPKTAPGPWINPPIIEDAVPTGDPTMLDPMNIAKSLNKVDVPTAGSMAAQIDEIMTKGKVDMPSRWGKLGKLDMIMTGVNVLGAIGDYKAERRKGKGVISSAVKSAANFAIGEALGFWGTVGVGLVKAVPGAVIKGADMLYKENRRMNSAARQQLFGDAQFMDTQQLATMRQSGMEMAKMANYNLQQTLMGNEATYLHR